MPGAGIKRFSGTAHSLLSRANAHLLNTAVLIRHLSKDRSHPMGVAECLVDSQFVVQVLAALAYWIHLVSAEK